jgi:5-oxoprolinase (ATP-hydrolysing) subunit A
MRETARRAAALGVQIGAHPSFPDRQNFGRIALKLAPEVLSESLRAQVRALLTIAEAEGAQVRHLKPHGALYNLAAVDAGLANVVLKVAEECGLAELVGPPHSELEAAAREAGLVFIAEGFADRSYERDGLLTPRTLSGSVFDDTARIAAQALSLAQSGRVQTRQGCEIDMPVRTLCLHSDTPDAAEHAAAVRRTLEAHGLVVKA